VHITYRHKYTTSRLQSTIVLSPIAIIYYSLLLHHHLLINHTTINMKILTKEEEEAHYRATIKGGAIGGMLGLAAGIGSVAYAARRNPNLRTLTVPFRAFIAVSVGTFTTIIGADRASVNYENHRNKQRAALLKHQSDYERFEEAKPFLQRAKDWGAENRYSIVFAAWLASMGLSLALVRRNRYLTTSQKIVQSRVYAQGLTLAVLLASFGLEASDVANKKGRWETVKVLDPTDPTHKRLIEKQIHHEKYEGEDQWMEVVASEERKLKERQKVHESELKTIREATAKAHKAP